MVTNNEKHKINFKDKRTLMEFVHALAKAVKAKDKYTENHSEMMSRIAVDLAKCLNLPESEVETVRLGAMLHDLGKIGIKESILLKPGKLTKEEYKMIKQHPQIGAEIVRTVHALKNAIPLILYHHERYDGTGYLEGLKGEEIPIGARIIGIADVYHALRSDRPYRKAYSKEKALEIIKEGADKQFDPKIVDIFLDLAKNNPL
ncbi:MAG: HD-GYP domain-containing protein [Candidatus Omnitrophica bacterium]|nr:HD-GYP domain-containing protein [Candidatus Omnitrophota bacterium]